MMFHSVIFICIDIWQNTYAFSIWMISAYPIPPHPINMFEHYQPSTLTPQIVREIAIWPNRVLNFQAMNLKPESRCCFLNQKLHEPSSFGSENCVYSSILCACPHVCMEEIGNMECEHGRQREILRLLFFHSVESPGVGLKLGDRCLHPLSHIAARKLFWIYLFVVVVQLIMNWVPDHMDHALECLFWKQNA